MWCAISTHLPVAVDVCISANFVFWSPPFTASASFSVVLVVLDPPEARFWAGQCMKTSISTMTVHSDMNATVHGCLFLMRHYMPTASGNGGAVAVPAMDESTEPVCASCIHTSSSAHVHACMNVTSKLQWPLGIQSKYK